MPLETEDRDAIAREIEGIAAEMGRRDFKKFIPEAWSIVEPDTPFDWNWHHTMMADDLQALANGDTDRLLYNVPPGTSKMTFFCVLLPAWVWTWAPHKKFLVASYIVDKSEESVLKIRDLVKSSWYRRNYPGVELREDQHAKRFFMNTRGGWVLATSTDGRGTGEHPDFAIIDDPHSAKKARSEADRKSATTWLRETMSTRGLAKRMSIGLIMQRLHDLDLTGAVLKLGTWKHICIPMRYEPKQGQATADLRPPPDKRDPRTKEGELLWPKVMTPDKVKAAEIELGAYGVAGQFQQRPAPEGGGIFKRSWIPIMDPPPADSAEWKRWLQCRMTRGWDTAATEEDGNNDPDYTVGVKMIDLGEGQEPRFVIMDVARDRATPAGVDQMMKSNAKADTRLCSIREEQEPGSAGKTVCAKRARDLVGYDYRAVPISGDKIVRSNPFRAACESGQVAMLRGHWNEAYLDELESFPAGAHDDQVDGSGCAFNDLTSGPRPTKAVKLTWG